MNVNKMYNIKKIVLCLQCRKDKGILDVMRRPAIVTVWHGTANLGISGI